MQFVANEMAAIIQNVSQNRTDKKITLMDLRYSVATAFLTMYPGITMYYQNKGHVLGHFPHPMIFYVKGLDNGNASCIWRVQLHPSTVGVGETPQKMYAVAARDHHSVCTVQYKTNVAPSKIHPDLKINPGEVKIIIESIIYHYKGFPFADGSSSDLPARNIFHFLMASPKATNSSGNERDPSGFFNSVTIFTPKPGLFDETPPT